MSAINILRSARHKKIYVLTDGALYMGDGTVTGLGTKVFTVPNWPGVVATRGAGAATALVGQQLTFKFPTFDSMVAGIEQAMPQIAESCAAITEACGFDTIDIIVAGISRARARPESYLLRTGDDLVGITREEVAANPDLVLPEAFKLIELPEVATAPAITPETIDAAGGFDGIDTDDQEDKIIAGLRFCIEMQRQQPGDIGDNENAYVVGGFASLTTIAASGIRQEILATWPEDKIDTLLKPAPADWPALRRALSPTVVSVSEGMTRQQRRAMERAAR